MNLERRLKIIYFMVVQSDLPSLMDEVFRIEDILKTDPEEAEKWMDALEEYFLNIMDNNLQGQDIYDLPIHLN